MSTTIYWSGLVVMGVVACLGLLAASYAMSSVAIVLGAACALACACSVAIRCLAVPQLGHLVLAVGCLMTFWLGALQCMRNGFAPSGLLIQREVGMWSADTLSLSIFYMWAFQLCGAISYRVSGRSSVLAGWTVRCGGSPMVADWVPYLLIAGMVAATCARHGFSYAAVIDGLIRSRAGDGARDIGLASVVIWTGYYGLAVVLCRFSLWRLRRLDWWLAPLTVTGFIMLALDGTRHHMLYVAFPIVSVVWHAAVWRARRSYLVVLGVCLCGIVLVYQGQSVARYRGWDSVLSGRIDASAWASIQGPDQFDAVNFSVMLVPDRHGYFMSSMAPYFVTHWVPSSVWPGKPYAPETHYFSDQWTGGADYSMLNITPSVIGQYHMNWGVLGVMWIGVVIGFACRWLDRAFAGLSFRGSAESWAWIGMVGAFLVASFRHFSPLYAMFPLLALPFFLATTKRVARRPSSSLF